MGTFCACCIVHTGAFGSRQRAIRKLLQRVGVIFVQTPNWSTNRRLGEGRLSRHPLEGQHVAPLEGYLPSNGATRQHSGENDHPLEAGVELSSGGIGCEGPSRVSKHHPLEGNCSSRGPRTPTSGGIAISTLPRGRKQHPERNIVRRPSTQRLMMAPSTPQTLPFN